MDPISIGMMAAPLVNQAVDGIFDISGRRQVRQQRKLTEIQTEANKQLADYSQGLQKDMIEYTRPAEQVKKLKEAGLNVGLMYQQGGAGGSTTGSASAGSASGSQASDEASRQGMAMQRMQTAMQAARQKAEIENIEADTDLKKEGAGKAGAEKDTIEASREAIVEGLKQSGQSDWLDNLAKRIKLETRGDEENELTMFGNKLYGTVSYQTGSVFNQEIVTNILKTEAEAGNLLAQESLTNEKVKGYWTELMNACIHANADAMKAAAIKLSAEWETGEFTNWKTILDGGIQITNAVVGGALGVSGVKRAFTKPQARQPKHKSVMQTRGKGWTNTETFER